MRLFLGIFALVLLGSFCAGALAESSVSSATTVFVLHGDDYFRSDEFQSLNTANKIEKISYDLSRIYKSYKNKDFPDFNTPYVKYELRIYTLRTASADNLIYLDLIKQAHIEAPVFLTLYEEAIDWAKHEKNKSAEALYQLSQDGCCLPPQLSSTHLERVLKREYLILAAGKGHSKAKAELENYYSELDAFKERDGY